MDWLQFFSSIVSSIAWPAAAVTLACLMRIPLAKMMLLIRTFKYKDLQIDIGEQLEAVREKVGAEGNTSDAEPQQPPLSFQALAKQIHGQQSSVPGYQWKSNSTTFQTSWDWTAERPFGVQ